MPKKLFTVTIKTEIVVSAENEVDAERLSLSCVRELNNGSFSAWSSPMTQIPAGWVLNSEPFRNPDDCTIGSIKDCIARGEAPAYEDLQAELRK